MPRLAEISGIGIPIQIRLAQSGISTTEALLKQGSIPHGRKAIAVKTRTSERMVLEWVKRADLRRVARLTEKEALILERAGVCSIPTLALAEPGDLYRKLAAINNSEKDAGDKVGLALVEDWIAQARNLQHIVVY